MGTTDATSWRGRDAVDRNGEKLGTIDEIYLDIDTDEPEWAAVSTGFLGMRHSLVPLQGARDDGGAVRVAHDKDTIKGAPKADLGGDGVAEDDERRLYDYYGISWSESRSSSTLADEGAGQLAGAGAGHGGPAGRDTSGPTTDEAMTRSEEELEVGTTRRQAGTARLRKWVETETVQQDVPVRRERARIEREPITDANVGQALEGPDISSEEHEVTLMEEEAVADTRVVPKERVRLEKEEVVEQQTVEAELRRERIAAEGDVEDELRG